MTQHFPLPKKLDPINKYTALLVRGAIVGTGIVGLAIFVRSSRWFATYQHVKQIPQDFYRLGIQMKGIVRELDKNGNICVEHIPAYTLPKILRFGRSSKSTNLLNLQLAGLDVSPVGIDYLNKDLRLEGRPIVFSVVKLVEKQKDVAEADITLKKPLRKINLNVELIRKGYARVFTLDNYEHVQALQFNSNYSRLITRLLTCEKVAERRGLGLWERTTWVETFASYPSTFVQIFKQSAIFKLCLLAYWLIYDLFLKLIAFSKQIFYLAKTFGIYLMEAYQRFVRLVDRLNGWYLNLKNSAKRTKRIE
ncbi:hypothetical protein Mgra_00003576 [Meloidogyne graminicola]|uniref:TNase-like domain-containing protein n=1 Tax=Meloidogyne graminicola TaxID=189291 RepID=A0A8S9ZV04_9BILA|nr:hypothetical protein Mgra_00003576 [Meloidogyne graminicola]